MSCLTGAVQAEDAAAILKNWYDGVAAAKTLSVDVSAAFKALQNGEEVQATEQSSSVSLRRPAEIVWKSQGDTALTILNDGKHLYEIVGGELKRYTEKEPFAAVGDLMSKSLLGSQMNMQQGLSLFGDALGAKSFDEFQKSLGKLEYVGAETVESAKLHHLRVVRDEIPTELWFAAEPLRLAKVAPDLKTIAAKNGRQLPPGIELTLAVTFKEWKYDAALSDDAFAFKAPEGYELTDDLFAPPPHRLLGSQAADFELDTLTGEKFKLSAQSGKVVVLDFWATWCGPCVAALPKITATTAKYKEKGVVFYAVNEGEEASIVREFLTAQKLQTPVLLDTESKVGELFGVEGIPQTVIIDKAGKMQVIHVGAGPDIGEKLAKELDEVLAGKQLADEKTKKKAK